MSDFSNLRVTPLGSYLLNNTLAGEGMHFRNLVLGSGTWTEHQQSSATPSALIHQRASFPIQRAEFEGNKVVVSVIVDNSDIAEGFALTEMGITAQHPTAGEVVCFIDYVPLERSSYLPGKNSGSTELKLDFEIVITDAEQVALNINDSFNWASKDDLSAHNTATNSHQDLRDRVDELAVAFDEHKFFRDQLNKLISGVAVGTEGRWKVALEGTITLDGYFIQDVLGSQRTLLSDSTVSYDSVIGSSAYIDTSSYGVIWGDSGLPYIVHHVSYNAESSAIRNCAILPKHNDIRWDFTIGNAYPVRAFAESDELIDQQTGVLDITECVIGSGLMTTAGLTSVMPVGSYGVLNAGYFDGKTWMNQRLEDCEIFDSGLPTARIAVKLSRPLKSISSFDVRRADGTWKNYSFGSATEAFEYAGELANNWCSFNVGASFADLGFSSEANFRANSAVLPKYKTQARRLRPIDNPSDVKLLGDVWLLWHPSNSFGRLLAWELNNYVHVASPSGSPKVRPIVGTLISPTVNRYDARFYTPEFNLPALPDSSLTMLVGGLCSINGTYHIIFWSKELIYDADWGDSRELAIVNQRQTELDENGNVIYTGCMAYDTGYAVAA